jgi:hypothetical protein
MSDNRFWRAVQVGSVYVAVLDGRGSDLGRSPGKPSGAALCLWRVGGRSPSPLTGPAFVSARVVR